MVNPLIKKCLHDLLDHENLDALRDIRYFTKQMMDGMYSAPKGVDQGKYIAWKVTHITCQQYWNFINHASHSELEEMLEYICDMLQPNYKLTS